MGFAFAAQRSTSSLVRPRASESSPEANVGHRSLQCGR
jgi:hypothetical protein